MLSCRYSMYNQEEMYREFISRYQWLKHVFFKIHRRNPTKIVKLQLRWYFSTGPLSLGLSWLWEYISQKEDIDVSSPGHMRQRSTVFLSSMWETVLPASQFPETLLPTVRVKFFQICVDTCNIFFLFYTIKFVLSTNIFFY